MPTNVFFNNFQSSQEQLLIENLIVESIKIYGQDMFYLPRRIKDKDKIYGQDVSSYYDKYYLLEMYIKNVDGFDGEGDFLSKFNIEIRDRITFTISRRSFYNEITNEEEELKRPFEGDIIYFPLNKKIFQVKFVEHESIFYQLGALQTYDLVCELFEYSGEKFNTGISDIDNIQSSVSISLTDDSILTEDTNPYYITDENGFKLINESYDLEDIDPTSDNEELQIESDTFIDFTEVDPFSEGRI